MPAGAVLDATCRVQREPSAEPLAGEIRQALILAPETSLLFVVTGAAADLDDLAAALVSVPAETRCVVLRAALGEAPSVVRQHGHDVITVGALAELPGVMAASS